MDIKLKVIFEDKDKTQIKRNSFINKPRILFSVGIAGISSLYYIALMYRLDENGFFKTSKEKVELPTEIYIAVVLFLFGIWAILYAFALWAGKSNNEVISTLTVAILCLISLFLTSFMLMNDSSGRVLGWVVCILC
ncbi:hypothetical protein JZO78_11430 [Enterococcus ureilyticus]|uniref:hypothetical protein n=1 Tax=Enterococcus ureilyticus TaxID=1131292 RepID=UPI001A939487|nr:hypothetical protein [Enterococcus ureilyticus]MBO0446957.1 hypothetical protein [Enterococcus ureilyticus]